ncbi:cytochrome c3 family protein [Novosphingobium sp. KCTC 2891]|uniref:cytochrome c3 family protein n=1 Tax=Novosphingobium sp. KCTC 2891 TaxID=2989730 RepID=UPI002223B120|nr:cytochrome c3 family protein [Novosphingobium sp. KCTC 2891]MCW1382164.1 cytochrome c3 family protein [Novosphingobium sp. KCTC 2891]
MTFLVRQIALKSNGEEIIRPSRVEGGELVIGRDASSGIHLPDLAVDPRHARVTEAAGGLLRIESIGDQPFDVDGRSTKGREIDPDVGAELGFGGHRITVSRDGESGLAVFTVRRVESVSESAEDVDLGTAYTLKGLLPGKRISAWGFAILMLVAFLAVPIWSYATYQPLAMHKDARRPAGIHGDTSWSSGHLSLSHKNLENDCQACHTKAFVAVTDNACLTCHTQDAHSHIPDKARLLRARGEPQGMAKFTQAVATAFNRPQGRCVGCHTEHEGAGAMPATRQQFCTDCHDGLRTRLPDTKIADAADFGTAHPQFRPAVIAGVGADGKPLLQRVAWTPSLKEANGLKFTHAQHLSKTNGVAQMVRRRAGRFAANDALGCQDCHKTEAGGARFKPVVMEEACESCHSLTFDQVGGTFRTLRHGQPEQVVAELRAFYRGGMPPRPASLSGLARRVPGDAALRATAADYARAVRFYPTRGDQAVAQVFSKGGMCYDCHTVTRGGSMATGGFTVQKVAQNGRYYHVGWFDHKDHRKTDCASCHVRAGTSNDASDLLVPGMDGPGGCRSCHVGESGSHLASVKVKDPVESGCAMCHAYHMDDGAPWKPADERKKGAMTTAVADRPRLPALMR